MYQDRAESKTTDICRLTRSTTMVKSRRRETRSWAKVLKRVGSEFSGGGQARLTRRSSPLATLSRSGLHVYGGFACWEDPFLCYCIFLSDLRVGRPPAPKSWLRHVWSMFSTNSTKIDYLLLRERSSLVEALGDTWNYSPNSWVSIHVRLEHSYIKTH